MHSESRKSPRERCRSGKVLPPPLNADTDGSPSPADRRGSAAGSSQTRVRPTRLRATLRAVHSESRQVAAQALTVRRSATATPATTRIKGRPTSHRPGACSRHPAGETASGGSTTGSGADTAGISWRDLRAGSRLNSGPRLRAVCDRDRRRTTAPHPTRIRRHRGGSTRTPVEDIPARRSGHRTHQSADPVREGADTARARSDRTSRTAVFTEERQRETEATARRREREQERERRARSPTPTRTAAERGEDGDPFETVQGSATPEGRKPTEEDFNWQPTYY